MWLWYPKSLLILITSECRVASIMAVTCISTTSTEYRGCFHYDQLEAGAMGGEAVSSSPQLVRPRALCMVQLCQMTSFT